MLRSVSGSTSSRGIAAVVGVGPRLGSAVARKFASEGYTVAILSRDLDKLSQLAEEIAQEAKAQVFALRVDCADARSVREAFEGVLSLGPVEVLVYNACEPPGDDDDGDAAAGPKPFLSISPDAFHRVIAVCAAGAFHCTQQVIPGMVERGRGTIIFTGSSASVTGFAGYPDLTILSFQKRGEGRKKERKAMSATLRLSGDGEGDSESVRERQKDPIHEPAEFERNSNPLRKFLTNHSASTTAPNPLSTHHYGLVPKELREKASSILRKSRDPTKILTRFRQHAQNFLSGMASPRPTTQLPLSHVSTSSSSSISGPIKSPEAPIDSQQLPMDSSKGSIHGGPIKSPEALAHDAGIPLPLTATPERSDDVSDMGSCSLVQSADPVNLRRCLLLLRATAAASFGICNLDAASKELSFQKTEVKAMIAEIASFTGTETMAAKLFPGCVVKKLARTLLGFEMLSIGVSLFRVHEPPDPGESLLQTQEHDKTVQNHPLSVVCAGQVRYRKKDVERCRLTSHRHHTHDGTHNNMGIISFAALYPAYPNSIYTLALGSEKMIPALLCMSSLVFSAGNLDTLNQKRGKLRTEIKERRNRALVEEVVAMDGVEALEATSPGAAGQLTGSHDAPRQQQ